MKRYLLLLLGAVLLVMLFLLVRTTALGSLFDPSYVKSAVASYGAFGPLFYMGIYVLACMVFFPGAPLTLVGGALFGPVFGTLYTVIGATVGAVCAFYFSRFFGGGILEGKAGSIGAKLGVYDESIKRNGFFTVLFLRFVPLFPFNGLNFGLGLTSVSSRDYVLGTFFGIIPGTFAFVFFGDSLGTLHPLKIGIALLVIICVSLIGKYVMAHYGKK
jgi:uncharacterized membrane protein YdjX (TVP38/TMEM64 family)